MMPRLNTLLEQVLSQQSRQEPVGRGGGGGVGLLKQMMADANQEQKMYTRKMSEEVVRGDV